MTSEPPRIPRSTAPGFPEIDCKKACKWSSQAKSPQIQRKCGDFNSLSGDQDALEKGKLPHVHASQPHLSLSLSLPSSFVCLPLSLKKCVWTQSLCYPPPSMYTVYIYIYIVYIHTYIYIYTYLSLSLSLPLSFSLCFSASRNRSLSLSPSLSRSLSLRLLVCLFSIHP